MIAVGTQASTSRAGVKYAAAHIGDVWATAGFHPAHFSIDWFHDKKEQASTEREAFSRAELLEIAKSPLVVAIGECGLDFFRTKDEESKKLQKEGFFEHIAVAEELGKPLMIHCRAAFLELIDILKSHGQNLKPGIIHFFTGTPDDAKQLLELGYSFTFGGVVTFARDYDEAIKLIPLDRILSETDAPYVSPEPYRGKRNEPAYVIESVKMFASLKGVTTEEMREAIWANAQRIFGI